MTKVDRSIESYDLEGLNDDLRERRGAGESLRDLADYVNRRILKSAINDHDVNLIVDIEGLYRILTDEEVSVGQRAEVEAKLEQGGVPVETVKRDFVSHQTIRHHLNDRLEIDTSQTARLTEDGALDRINWAQSQSEGIIENTLEQLQNMGHLDTCSFDVTSTIRVTCDDCGQSFRLYEFIERGRCGCHPDSETTTNK